MVPRADWQDLVDDGDGRLKRRACVTDSLYKQKPQAPDSVLGAFWFDAAVYG